MNADSVTCTNHGEFSRVSFFRVEYTDTFGGEANYSWCRRAIIVLRHCAPLAELKRKAKKAVNLSGCPGRWHGLGGDYEFRPYGSCTVLFTMDA